LPRVARTTPHAVKRQKCRKRDGPPVPAAHRLGRQASRAASSSRASARFRCTSSNRT
jgi:hypothetical protein